MGQSAPREVLQVDCPHPGGRHAVACQAWGPANAPAVLCVHGLTRNARDFEPLAMRLAPGLRVIAADLPGRGASPRLETAALYGDDTYLADLRRVMDQLNTGPVRWIGTSLGARLGMKMAAAHPERVAALVLNDMGAELDGADLDRLRREAATEASFAGLDEAERWMRRRYAAFGRLSDARWREFTEASVERAPDGRLRPCFDVRAVPKAALPARVDQWALYNAIRCPVFVLRGAESALLSRATCEAMARTGPRAQWIEVPGAGHAPDLSGELLTAAIEKFLEATR
jgi:pimeloyl-ACP methyl ester carboxylesterase